MKELFEDDPGYGAEQEVREITGCAKIFAWALLIALSACIVAAFVYLG